MAKSYDYEMELSKLKEIFKDVDEGKMKLVEGMIQDAAFLYAENNRLKEAIALTGMVKTHPSSPGIQKPTEAAKQYLKSVNTYSVVIKTLNGILAKNSPDGDDEFEAWLKNETGGITNGD